MWSAEMRGDFGEDSDVDSDHAWSGSANGSGKEEEPSGVERAGSPQPCGVPFVTSAALSYSRIKNTPTLSSQLQVYKSLSDVKKQKKPQKRHENDFDKGFTSLTKQANRLESQGIHMILALVGDSIDDSAGLAAYYESPHLEGVRFALIVALGGRGLTTHVRQFAKSFFELTDHEFSGLARIYAR
jgi:hypothetical protein